MDVFTRMMSFIKNCKKLNNVGESTAQSVNADLEAGDEHSREDLTAHPGGRCQGPSNSCSSQVLNAAAAAAAAAASGDAGIQTWQSCPSSPAGAKNGSPAQRISGKFAVSIFSPTICLSTVSVRQCLDACGSQKKAKLSSSTTVPASLSSLPGHVDVCVVQPQALSKIKHHRDCVCESVRNFSGDASTVEEEEEEEEEEEDRDVSTEQNFIRRSCATVHSKTSSNSKDVSSAMKQSSGVSSRSVGFRHSTCVSFQQGSVENGDVVRDDCGTYESRRSHQKHSRLPILESSPARINLVKPSYCAPISKNSSAGARNQPGQKASLPRGSSELSTASVVGRERSSSMRQKQNLPGNGETAATHCLNSQYSSDSDSAAAKPGSGQTNRNNTHCSRKSSSQDTAGDSLPRKRRSLLPVLGSLHGKQNGFSSTKTNLGQEPISQLCDGTVVQVYPKAVDSDCPPRSYQGSLRSCPGVEKKTASPKSCRSNMEKIFRFHRSSSLKDREANEEWNIPAEKERSKSQEDRRRNSTLLNEPSSVQGSPVICRRSCRCSRHAGVQNTDPVEASQVHLINQVNSAFYDTPTKPWAKTLREYEKSPSPVRSRKSTPESAGPTASNSTQKIIGAHLPSAVLSGSGREVTIATPVDRILETKSDSVLHTKLQQAGNNKTSSSSTNFCHYSISNSSSEVRSGSDSEKTDTTSCNISVKKDRNNAKNQAVRSLLPVKMLKTNNDNSNKKQQKAGCTPKVALLPGSSRLPMSRTPFKEQNSLPTGQKRYLFHQNFDPTRNSSTLDIGVTSSYPTGSRKIFEDPSDLRNQLPTEEALNQLLAVVPAATQSTSRISRSPQPSKQMIVDEIESTSNFLDRDVPLRLANDTKSASASSEIAPDLDQQSTRIISFCKFDKTSSDIVVEKRLFEVSKALEKVQHDDIHCIGSQQQQLKTIPAETSHSTRTIPIEIDHQLKTIPVGNEHHARTRTIPIEIDHKVKAIPVENGHSARTIPIDTSVRTIPIKIDHQLKTIPGENEQHTRAIQIKVDHKLKTVPVKTSQQLEREPNEQFSETEAKKEIPTPNKDSELIGSRKTPKFHTILIENKVLSDSKCISGVQSNFEVTGESLRGKSKDVFNSPSTTIIPIKVIKQESSVIRTVPINGSSNLFNGASECDSDLRETDSASSERQKGNAASVSNGSGMAPSCSSKILYSTMPPFGEWISEHRISDGSSSRSLDSDCQIDSREPAFQKERGSSLTKKLTFSSKIDDSDSCHSSAIDSQGQRVMTKQPVSESVVVVVAQPCSFSSSSEVSKFDSGVIAWQNSKASTAIENDEMNDRMGARMPYFTDMTTSKFKSSFVSPGGDGIFDNEVINRPLIRGRPFQKSFSFIDSRPELMTTRFVDETRRSEYNRSDVISNEGDIRSSVLNPEQQNKFRISNASLEQSADCRVKVGGSQIVCDEICIPGCLNDFKKELDPNLGMNSASKDGKSVSVSSVFQPSSPLPSSRPPPPAPPPLHCSQSDAILTRQDPTFDSSCKVSWYMSDIESTEFLENILIRGSCASLPQNLKQKPAFMRGQRTLSCPRSTEYASKRKSPELSCFRKSGAVSPDSDDELNERDRKYEESASTRVHSRLFQKLFRYRSSTFGKESRGDSLHSPASSVESSISREGDASIDRDDPVERELDIKINHYCSLSRRGRLPYHGCYGDPCHTPPLAVFLSNEDISSSVFPLRHVVSEPMTNKPFMSRYMPSMTGMKSLPVAKERPKSDCFDAKLANHLRHRLSACFSRDQSPKFILGEKPLELWNSQGRASSPSTMSNQSTSTLLMMRSHKSMSQPHLIRRRAKHGPPQTSLCWRSSSLPEGLNQSTVHETAARTQKSSRHSIAVKGDVHSSQVAEFSSDDDLENLSVSFASETSDRSYNSTVHHRLSFGAESRDDGLAPVLADALWDHVTLDQDELSFQSGDVIEVVDQSDRYWWWGKSGQKSGWCPSSFVRIRRPQMEMISSFEEATKLTRRRSSHSPHIHTRTPSMGRSRMNVIQEIIKAENDYVKHLRDVVEGYLERVKQHPDMFPGERVATIFGNIEDIYEFSRNFLFELEKRILVDLPELSEIGQCFINNRKGFEIYSEYCNNHPLAIEELCSLQQDEKYSRFFETCRLQQKMIEIPLEGFLLTPIQKICKYPLQLKELIKYTWPNHQDYASLQMALDTMKEIAALINERKRKMESLEKLAHWQANIGGWQGAPLIENSSELIYSGELTKINARGWHQERIFFLFDHQLIYCKKDLLWRHLLVYRGRIDIDHCVIHLIPDGRDVMFGLLVKNAWKLYDHLKDKWYLLMGKTAKERDRWLQAFEDERRRVSLDRENGFALDSFKRPIFFPHRKRKVHSKKSIDRHPRKRVTIQKIEDVEKPSSISTDRN